MTTLKKITIGLPIYNEEARLPDLLNSLVDNVRRLEKAGYKVNVVACLNGTTDHSPAILEAFNSDPKIPFKINVIRSTKGKFLAQRAIAERAGDDPIVFLDSDILLRPNCIINLVRHLERHPLSHIVYAEGRPVISPNLPDSPFLRMQRAYYKLRGELPRRSYFVGRAFVIRNGEYLTRDIGLDKRIENYIEGEESKSDAKELLEKLGVLRGDVPCDDMYLSFATIEEHGQRGIQKISGTFFEYTPNLTIHDFINYNFRIFLARHVIKKLFPEFENIHIMRNNHSNILDYLDGNQKIPLSHAEITALKQRSRIIEHLRTVAKANPIGIARMRGFWHPTTSTKAAYADYRRAAHEVVKTRRGHKVELVDHGTKLDPNVETRVSLGLIFRNDGKMMVVINKRGFDIPGGRLEESEKDTEALVREVREETGIEMKDHILVGHILSKGFKSPNDQAYLSVFATRVKEGDDETFAYTREIVGRVWMTPEDFLMLHNINGKEIIKKLIAESKQKLFPPENPPDNPYDAGQTPEQRTPRPEANSQQPST